MKYECTAAGKKRNIGVAELIGGRNIKVSG
jgi:hypothetical protein